MSERINLGRAASAVMLGMLLSSAAGFVRAFVIAGSFGSSSQTDALFAALTVPQMLYDQFLGAAMAALFIPAFARLRGADEDVWPAVRRVALGIGAAGLAPIFLLELSAGWVMPLLVSGFRLRMHGGALNLSITLLRLLLPGLLLMGLSGVGASALYALGRRGLAAGSTALYHLGVVAAALLGGMTWGVRGLAAGALVGWGAQLGLLAFDLLRTRARDRDRRRFPLLSRHESGATEAPVPLCLPPAADHASGRGLQRRPARLGLGPVFSRARRVCAGDPYPRSWGPSLTLGGQTQEPRSPPTDRSMLRLWLPLGLSGLVGIAGQVADLHFKSRLPESGGLSDMQYATQLIQFPIGLLGAAVALAVLPGLSGGTEDQRRRVFGAALKLGVLITVPAAIALIVLRGPVVALTYQRGSFTAMDASHTAIALLGYAPQLPFVAATQILVLAYFAGRDTRVPAAVNGIGVAIYVVIALALLPRLSILGLALANTASLALQTTLLAVLVARRWGVGPWRGILAPATRVAIAAALMAIVVAATSHLLGTGGSTFGTRLAQLAVPASVGLATYAAALLPRDALRRGDPDRTRGVVTPSRM